MICSECARLKQERAEAYSVYFESEHGDSGLEKKACRDRWVKVLEAEESHRLACHGNELRDQLRASSFNDWMPLFTKLGYKPNWEREDR